MTTPFHHDGRIIGDLYEHLGVWTPRPSYKPKGANLASGPRDVAEAELVRNYEAMMRAGTWPADPPACVY